MARGPIAGRVLPVVAVGLGLGHAAFLGGLATPVAFTRAVLAVGVLCPLMMGQSSTRIGHILLRPQARLLPFLVSLALGPALALVLGRCLLSNHPEQALALLLLSLLPGSALAPIWASGTHASGSTATALALIGLTIAAFVSLPLLAGPLALVASFTAFRDLALLGVMPLAVGSACRVALTDAFEPEQYAATVEPMRQTVLQASLAVLLFTSTASDEVARMFSGADDSLPAFAAVALLYLGLGVGCGGMLLAFRRRFSRAAARATLQVTATRQTVLAISVLPLVVTPSALQSALGVPLFGLILELVLGTTALALHGSWTQLSSASGVGNRDGQSSIVPEER
jgi:ACR3 family arsenite efflux pump ArsB